MLDMLFAAMMIAAIIKGLRNGLVVAIFSIVGWLAGLYAAVKFSDTVAEWIRSQGNIDPKWLTILSFIIVFFGVTFLIGLGAKIISKSLDIALMGWLNKLGGIFFYVLLYTLIFSVIIYFADKVKLISEDTIASSRVYPVLQPIIIKLKQLL